MPVTNYTPYGMGQNVRGYTGGQGYRPYDQGAQQPQGGGMGEGWVEMNSQGLRQGQAPMGQQGDEANYGAGGGGYQPAGNWGGQGFGGMAQQLGQAMQGMQRPQPRGAAPGGQMQPRGAPSAPAFNPNQTPAAHAAQSQQLAAMRNMTPQQAQAMISQAGSEEEKANVLRSLATFGGGNPTFYQGASQALAGEGRNVNEFINRNFAGNLGYRQR